MENIVLTSISLGLLAMFINSEYLLGTCMFSRPIVIGFLTGLILGNPTQGTIIGATFELAFIGAFSIGAVIPPDTISGTILGTAFAITTNNANNPALAMSLGIPIASLVLIIKNFLFITLMPHFIHKADYYADKTNIKGIQKIHFMSGFFTTNLVIGLIVGLSFFLGNDIVKIIVDSIPPFITQGFTIAIGLLPAYGLALLLKNILNKNNFIFLILGFSLSTYLKIPITGVAIFSIILSILLSDILPKPSLDRKYCDSVSDTIHEDEF